MSTAGVLHALFAVDTVGKWETVQLRTTFLAADGPSDFPDPLCAGAGAWENVPLTRSATDALLAAAEVARTYRLIPVPPGVLVLGLVADPRSGAARALLSDSDLPHAGLLHLIQDEALDTRLEGVEELLGGAPSQPADIAPSQSAAVTTSAPAGVPPSYPGVDVPAGERRISVKWTLDSGFGGDPVAAAADTHDTSRAPTPPPSAAALPGLDDQNFPWLASATVVSRPEHATGSWLLATGDRMFRAHPVGSMADDEARRVRGEASVSLALGAEPGVLPTLDVVDDGEWLVVELPRTGASLRDHLQSTEAGADRRSSVDYADAVASVAATLHLLHDRGIPHGGIRPENLLEHPETRDVYVSDLTVEANDEADHRYAAPEQFLGEVGPSIDQYALGVVARDLLTVPGAAPVTAPVHAVLQRATSPRPGDRFASLSEFGAELRQAVRTEAPRHWGDRVESMGIASRVALGPAALGALFAAVLGAAAAREMTAGVALAVVLTLTITLVFPLLAWGVVAAAAGIRGRRTWLSLPFAYRPAFLLAGCAVACGAVFLGSGGAPKADEFVWPVIGVFAVRALLAPAPPESGAWAIRAVRLWERRRMLPAGRRAALTLAAVLVILGPAGASVAARVVWPVDPELPTSAANRFGPLITVWNFRLAAGQRKYEHACKHFLELAPRGDRAPCRDLVRIVAAVQDSDLKGQDPRHVFAGKGGPESFPVQEAPAPDGLRVWRLLAPGNREIGGMYTQDTSGDRVVVMIARRPTTEPGPKLRSLWLYELSRHQPEKYADYAITSFRACELGPPGTGRQPPDCVITDRAPASAVRTVLRRGREGRR